MRDCSLNREVYADRHNNMKYRLAAGTMAVLTALSLGGCSSIINPFGTNEHGISQPDVADEPDPGDVKAEKKPATDSSNPNGGFYATQSLDQLLDAHWLTPQADIKGFDPKSGAESFVQPNNNLDYTIKPEVQQAIKALPNTIDADTFDQKGTGDFENTVFDCGNPDAGLKIHDLSRDDERAAYAVNQLADKYAIVNNGGMSLARKDLIANLVNESPLLGNRWLPLHTLQEGDPAEGYNGTNLSNEAKRKLFSIGLWMVQQGGFYDVGYSQSGVWGTTRLTPDGYAEVQQVILPSLDEPGKYDVFIDDTNDLSRFPLRYSAFDTASTGNAWRANDDPKDDTEKLSEKLRHKLVGLWSNPAYVADQLRRTNKTHLPYKVVLHNIDRPLSSKNNELTKVATKFGLTEDFLAGRVEDKYNGMVAQYQTQLGANLFNKAVPLLSYKPKDLREMLYMTRLLPTAKLMNESDTSFDNLIKLYDESVANELKAGYFREEME